MYLRKQITVIKLFQVIKKKKERRVEAKQRAVGVVSPAHFGCCTIKSVCFLQTWVSWGAMTALAPVVHALALCAVVMASEPTQPDQGSVYSQFSLC